MAANNEVKCWVAEGYSALEEPPSGPYISLDDAREGNCQMCGLRGDGALQCWKKPVAGDWESACGGRSWSPIATGPFSRLLGSTFHSIEMMNNLGQLVWFDPVLGGSVYIAPLFESGGFVEARLLVGLRQSGELLFYENGVSEGVPVIDGTFTAFQGDKDGGCAIRQADSRVVCWGEGEHGQFDPPTE
ncbi:MAG: hypothetical protein IPK80_03740 [Nannocystis sp.]|nr:hypothetical protein [Nannocystis sp.]